eukprot:1968948-Prymnesium_polylepis.1
MACARPNMACAHPNMARATGPSSASSLRPSSAASLRPSSASSILGGASRARARDPSERTHAILDASKRALRHVAASEADSQE